MEDTRRPRPRHPDDEGTRLFESGQAQSGDTIISSLTGPKGDDFRCRKHTSPMGRVKRVPAKRGPYLLRQNHLGVATKCCTVELPSVLRTGYTWGCASGRVTTSSGKNPSQPVRDMSSAIPRYFDHLLDAWYAGNANRCAHFGHWDEPSTFDQMAQPAVDLQSAQHRMDDVLIELSDVTSGLSILDVGCGLGGLVERIDAKHENMQLTGLGTDPRQLEICHRLKSRGNNRLNWQEADACDLPFDDASFDRVFCVEAMFHFASRRRFIAEADRVLRPGGRLIVSDIALSHSPIQTVPRFAIEALLNDGYGPWPDPWCEQGQAADIFRDTGLSDVHHTDATQNTLPTWKFIISEKWSEQSDPVEIAARSALMLCWLHRNGALRYDYVSANKA
jgi:MPBQ/MSBQ methyltransferase